MYSLILLGAPGSGKGTAAESIVAEFRMTHVSTGDMLREAIRNGTSVGKRAKGYMEAGELVPDDVIIQLVEERIAREGDAARLLFDGFPRNVQQAELLDAALRKRGARVDRVLLLEVDPELVYRRIEGRRVCRSCGAVYHISRMVPPTRTDCAQCGGELYQRADDTRETAANRLAVFDKETAPLIAYYSNLGVLARVDAGGHPDDTMVSLRKLLEPAG